LFTNRPVSTMPNMPNMLETASRAWLEKEKTWTYGFGDARAIAGQELTEISKPIYDIITSSREHSGLDYDSHHETTIARAMEKFNTDMTAWSEHFSALFASCTSK
jgi:hypothetical protein